jgi:hypothetical protein
MDTCEAVFFPLFDELLWQPLVMRVFEEIILLSNNLNEKKQSQIILKNIF